MTLPGIRNHSLDALAAEPPPPPPAASFGFAGEAAGLPLHYSPCLAANEAPGQVAVILGYTPAGHPLMLTVTSAAYLDALDAAVRAARARLGAMTLPAVAP